LAILSRADTKGRICKDNKQAEMTIDLFKDFCMENGCLAQSKQFLSDNARFAYFFERVGHPDLDRYNKGKKIAHVMSGLPGSGKDFYLHKNLVDLPVVSMDDIREEMGVSPTDNQGTVSQVSKEKCRELMRKDVHFVFNATNFVKETRARMIRLFRQYGYVVHIHYIEPSFETIKKQNKNRNRVVPETIIEEMFTKLEPPTLLECHKLSLNC
jgi:predicted kinase